MNKIKNLFSTPKKAVITCLCIAGGLVLIGTTTVLASKAIAENNSIGKEAAIQAALADAGVDSSQAGTVKTEFEFEDGQYLYEVDFTVNGTEYDYLVKATDGTILSRDSEPSEYQQGNSGENAENSTQQNNGQTEAQQGITAEITLEKAKEIVLSDAGIGADEVTYTKERLEQEDGIVVYELEFYTATTEYDYEVDASSGAVYSKSSEPFTAGRELDLE